MNRQESEQDRLKRLRDQQIRARDPSVKEQRISQHITAQQKRKRKNENFIKDSVGDVSHKVKGVYIGAVLGLVIMITLPMLIEGRAAIIIGVAAFPFSMALGFIIGASFDWRDELRDHIK
ncbi:MAG: efflux RND transporter permease subunit [Chloroflexi bacterium]|nr:efflux RND transporter permease subunit [Chloroflexota bacterium]